MSIPFENLDRGPIVVEYANDQRQVSMRGIGRLHVTENGIELHIEISDKDGGFTLIFQEAKWNGSISSLDDGSYRIRIGAQ